jgi:hypothetical protein
MSDDSGPHLILFEKDGSEPAASFSRTGLVIVGQGILTLGVGSLAFHNAHAQPLAEVVTTDKGMLLHLWDAGGRFSLGTSGASLVMLDKDGKVIWRAP